MMTRKEKEKVLLDGLGLNVGDKIMLTNCGKSPYEIKEKCNVFYLHEECDNLTYAIDILLTEEFEKYVEPKKWKDVRCASINECDLCPLNHISSICLSCSNEDTLQECLDNSNLDDDEREFYQKRIDKEYKEEN